VKRNKVGERRHESVELCDLPVAKGGQQQQIRITTNPLEKQRKREAEPW